MCDVSFPTFRTSVGNLFPQRISGRSDEWRTRCDAMRTIARDWNARASGVGYVTRFEVEKSNLDGYAVQQAGGRTILEYWIPAEDLEELNQHIVGLIDVVAEYR